MREVVTIDVIFLTIIPPFKTMLKFINLKIGEKLHTTQRVFFGGVGGGGLRASEMTSPLRVVKPKTIKK